MTKSTILSLAAAGAFVLLTAPAFSQTSPTAPAQPGQQEAPGADTGTMGQPPEHMREMMREMMQDMMRETGPQGMRPGMRGDMRGETRRGMREGPGRMGEHYGMRTGEARDRPGRHGMMRYGREGMMGHGPMHGAGMRIMFAIMDADGDGALTLEEVQDFHERIFNAIDQNDDGEVTMEEIRAFFTGERE